MSERTTPPQEDLLQLEIGKEVRKENFGRIAEIMVREAIKTFPPFEIVEKATGLEDGDPAISADWWAKIYDWSEPFGIQFTTTTDPLYLLRKKARHPRYAEREDRPENLIRYQEKIPIVLVEIDGRKIMPAINNFRADFGENPQISIARYCPKSIRENVIAQMIANYKQARPILNAAFDSHLKTFVRF